MTDFKSISIDNWDLIYLKMCFEKNVTNFELWIDVWIFLFFIFVKHYRTIKLMFMLHLKIINYEVYLILNFYNFFC